MKICPVYKINNGIQSIQSFNCECNLKICEKYINDNVYTLKYNQSRGCGIPYNPKKEKESSFKFRRKRNKEKQQTDTESEEREKSETIYSKNIYLFYFSDNIKTKYEY